MTKRCMLDLETAGTTPGSLIWSIGACVFDDNGILGEKEFAVSCFHAYLDPIQQARIGMTIDPGTVLWWLGQKPEAQKALTIGSNMVCGKDNVGPALHTFDQFLKINEVTEIWGNGADFDIPLLAALYRAMGYGSALPWKYNAGRCVRTVFASIGKRCGDFGTENVLAHDALQDAIYQAKEVTKALAFIRNQGATDASAKVPEPAPKPLPSAAEAVA